jgi:hypothetical protein
MLFPECTCLAGGSDARAQRGLNQFEKSKNRGKNRAKIEKNEKIENRKSKKRRNKSN